MNLRKDHYRINLNRLFCWPPSWGKCTLVIFVSPNCAHIVDPGLRIAMWAFLAFFSRSMLFSQSLNVVRMFVGNIYIQLSAMDLLALASMKNAAKCDK